MDTKTLTQSLAMDLLRVALGLHRGSFGMASRFKEEALRSCQRLAKNQTNGYLAKLVKNTQDVLKRDDNKVAEDALMYSTLLQNFALKKLV